MLPLLLLAVVVTQDSIRSRSDSAPTLPSVRVVGRQDDLTGIALSASQGRVGRRDLARRPLLREGELLEAVPGMILTQHSGDGKANQMFVRGFNLDHGVDFQTRIESMPLNLPTHAHGQGYTDVNLLIPELVDHISYALGPYHPEFGDFGSAGGATIELARSLARPITLVEGGAWNHRRVVAAGSHARGTHTVLLGGEAKGYDGPWQIPQGLTKRSGVARYSWVGGRSSMSLLALAYSNRWRASDQIPERASVLPSIGRFGQIDTTLGGQTERYSLSLDIRRRHGRGETRVQAFGVRYGFTLFSNFTYLLERESGDQIRQRDDRWFGGGEVSHEMTRTWGGVMHEVRGGIQARTDDAAVSLAQTAQRIETAMVRADDVRQSSGAVYGSIVSRWRPRVRTVLGWRGDAHRFRVHSDDNRNSGYRSASIGSPKLALIAVPRRGVELYVGGGLGYHSNDARGTTITRDPRTGEPVDAVNPLVRSRGGEVGARLSGARALRTTVSLWTLGLDSELLFVGDAGTTEPQGRSQRQGITIANYWEPWSSVAVDADVSLNRARFRDAPADARAIPGAMEQVIAGGVRWSPGRGGSSVAVRVRHFGAHPLVESNAVRGRATTLVTGQLQIPIGAAGVSVTALNLFNAAGRDVQYFYASRLAGEPVVGVEDVHFHPVEPRQLRIGVTFGNR